MKVGTFTIICDSCGSKHNYIYIDAVHKPVITCENCKAEEFVRV